MQIRGATLEDLEQLSLLYHKGLGTRSLEQAKVRLKSILQKSSHQTGQATALRWHCLVALEDQRIIAMALSGPPQLENVVGSELQLLAVPKSSFGRRLSAQLLRSLKQHLRASRLPCLWINAPRANLSPFLQAGAVDLAPHPPAQGSALARRRLRLQCGPAPTLQTARLHLRPWRPEDHHLFFQLNGDVLVNKFLPGPLSYEESSTMLDGVASDIKQHGFGFWAVEHQLSEGIGGKVIGMIGISPVVDIPPVQERIGPTLEIAWRLAPKFWRQGYALEGAQASIEFAFSALAVQELVAFTVPGNTPSRNLMKKLGFEHDKGGEFEHPRLPPGHPLRRHLLYRKRCPAHIINTSYVLIS